MATASTIAKKASRRKVKETKMYPMPQDENELKTEARRLGLLNPMTKIDTPRKELLSHIWASYCANRSFCLGSILLCGSSGVGKSSTINHLFNCSLAKTSNQRSETRSTTEYVLKADYPKYQVAELRLGLVDSPGFNDTDGIKQDACNFYSIKQFYDKHPKLNGRYPNLIFILVQATDTRIDGDNSNFARSLRCLSTLGLVDESKPNVVAILTFACSLPQKNWKDRIEEKKEVVKVAIFKFLHVHAPVVEIENDYEGYELEVVDDFTRLPNGKLQPSNLYQTCKQVLTGNKDPLGILMFNACFISAKSKKSIEKGFEVHAKNASVDQLNLQEMSMYEANERAIRGGVKDPIIKGAVDFIKGKSIDEKEAENVRKMAQYLKNMGAQDEMDCKLISLGGFQLQNDEPISTSGKEFLEMIGVREQSHAKLASLIGQGYNIRHDKTVSAQIFNLKATDCSYGVTIPSAAKIQNVNETICLMDEFEDINAVKKGRLRQLGINVDIMYEEFEFGMRAGQSMKNNKNVATGMREFSVLWEVRNFRVVFGNFEDENLDFSVAFRRAVEELPSQYDINQQEQRTTFEDFFRRWGHCVVTSAYGGGAVEAKVTENVVDSSISTMEENFAEIRGAMALVFNASVSCDSKDENIKKSLTYWGKSQNNWKGGATELQLCPTAQDPRAFIKWKLSLTAKPVMLDTSMSLEPIYTVVKILDKTKGAACQEAWKDFLGGDFQIIDKQMKREKEAEKQRKIEKTREAAEKTTREETVEDPQPSKKCFPLSATVKALEGEEVKEKRMDAISVGDIVLTKNMKSQQDVFSPVVMFAHFNQEATGNYLSISLENGNIIKLSHNHLLMSSNQMKMIPARDIEKGDQLFIGENGLSKVIAIEEILDVGVFAPVTREGTIYVNNILASCYASVDDYTFLKGMVNMTGHDVAHLGLLPMRIWYRSFRKVARRFRKDPDHVSELHPYIRWLCKRKLPWMDKKDGIAELIR